MGKVRSAVVIALLAATVILGGCATDVSVEKSGDMCKQTREKQFIGLTYSTDVQYTNC